MMEVQPLLATPSHDAIHHQQLHGNHNYHHNHSSSSTSNLRTSLPTMIIDASNHNSPMPVSPKQGETMTEDGLASKQGQPLVQSSIPSWEDDVSLSKSRTTSVSSPSVWPSSPLRNCLTSDEKRTHTLSSELTPSRQTNSSSLHTPSVSPSSSSAGNSSPHAYLPLVDSFSHSAAMVARESADNSESENPKISDMLKTLTESYPHLGQAESQSKDFPVSSAKATLASNPTAVSGTIGLDASSLERRSRRKPTVGDIVRRVRPPVDAGPYDSGEESDTENDHVSDEMIFKMQEQARKHDEVDGNRKSPHLQPFTEGNQPPPNEAFKFQPDSREDVRNDMRNDEDTDAKYSSPQQQIENSGDDDEQMIDEDGDMELRSEGDSPSDSDKNAFLKDVPLNIYNLMHEVKVNAHAMYMKTATSVHPEEARARREQYLLQLLSDLRDRCLDEGLRPEVIASVLKDVELEVTLLGEDLEDEMKEEEEDVDAPSPGRRYFPDMMGPYPYNKEGDLRMDPADVGNTHFLGQKDGYDKTDADRDEMSKDKRAADKANSQSSHKLPSFLNMDPSSLHAPLPPSISTPSSISLPAHPLSAPPNSSQPPTTPSSSSSSSTTASSPNSENKPIIVTVSADMKGGPPPLVPSGGGLPPLHPLASNLSETAFSPNMFGSGKLPPWFPGMPLYPFSPAGPLDHALARKFLPFEGGKMADNNADKDYLKCQYCERTFRRQKNLENHVENTHQNKSGQLKPRRDTADMYFKCSHCPYTTKHQSNLYVHLRIHTGERPYICGACGVQYSQSHSLKSHIINKHDGIMSYYIKEKRTRSPRGIGYLTTQVMHDNSIFKLPPPPLMGPPPPHHPHHLPPPPHTPPHGLGSHPSSNLDFVTKAIEMAKAEQQQHEQTLKQRHMSGHDNGSGNQRPSMPPSSPLGSSHSSSGSGSGKSGMNSPSNSSLSQSSSTPSSGPHGGPPMFSSPGMGSHHGNPPPPSPFFLNGPHLSPALMFGELPPPHMRTPNHMGGGGSGSGRRSSGDHTPHPHPAMFPGFPHFPPGSGGFPSLSPFSPTGNSNNNSNSSGGSKSSYHQFSSNSSSSSHPHLHLPTHPSHLPSSAPSPTSPFMHATIKKEPQTERITPQPSPQHHRSSSHPPASSPNPLPNQSLPAQSNHHEQQPRSQSGQQEDGGAMDLRKRSPPATPSPTHDPGVCGGKENCAHAARLKYLRLNVVRMLGILVPNLNFAEKGISAESESVDELLQDVIESNQHEEEMVTE